METNRDAVHAAGGSFLSSQTKNVSSVEHLGQKAAPEKKLQNRGPRAVLDLREDYTLTKWLHDRVPTRGESYQDVYREAEQEFGDDPIINKLNADHIKTRMEAFATTLPRPPAVELTMEERLERAEKMLSVLARGVLSGAWTMQDRAWLSDFISEVRLK